jgi:hypothetical protein
LDTKIVNCSCKLTQEFITTKKTKLLVLLFKA